MNGILFQARTTRNGKRLYEAWIRWRLGSKSYLLVAYVSWSIHLLRLRGLEVRQPFSLCWSPREVYDRKIDIWSAITISWKWIAIMTGWQTVTPNTHENHPRRIKEGIHGITQKLTVLPRPVCVCVREDISCTLISTAHTDTHTYMHAHHSQNKETNYRSY